MGTPQNRLQEILQSASPTAQCYMFGFMGLVKMSRVAYVCGPPERRMLCLDKNKTFNVWYKYSSVGFEAYEQAGGAAAKDEKVCCVFTYNAAMEAAREAIYRRYAM